METDLRRELLSLEPFELEEWLLSAGEAKYRAKQIFPQLHKGLSPDQMTNLGKKLQQKLREAFVWHLPVVERKLISKLDGTVKYLFSLADGNCVESVVMRYEHGNTICISSQVGCRMGCKFCASTIGGRVRDLTCAELLGQVIAAQKDLGERISNIVMMGACGGEELDALDDILAKKVMRKLESQNPIYFRNTADELLAYLDELFGEAQMKLCRDYINRIRRNA